MIISLLRCPEQDSNLHVSQHSHLKRARLPFRHLGFFVMQNYCLFSIPPNFHANIFRPLPEKCAFPCAATFMTWRRAAVFLCQSRVSVEGFLLLPQ